MALTAAGRLLAPTGAAPILEMRNIAKGFDATQALEDVSLSLSPARCTRCSARTAPANRP